MRTTLLFLIFFVSVTQSAAEVYKSIGPNGKVQYTDRPVSGAATVQIEKERPAASAASGEDETDATTVAGSELGPYTTFMIVTPEPNETLRHEAGEVVVSLIIDPPLEPEHNVRILLDGQAAPEDIHTTQFKLDEVAYGSHRIQAEVIDRFDVPIARTGVTDFHLRRPLPESALP